MAIVKDVRYYTDNDLVNFKIWFGLGAGASVINVLLSATSAPQIPLAPQPPTNISHD